jgi:hypothetical protein
MVRATRLVRIAVDYDSIPWGQGDHSLFTVAALATKVEVVIRIKQTLRADDWYNFVATLERVMRQCPTPQKRYLTVIVHVGRQAQGTQLVDMLRFTNPVNVPAVVIVYHALYDEFKRDWVSLQSRPMPTVTLRHVPVPWNTESPWAAESASTLQRRARLCDAPVLEEYKPCKRHRWLNPRSWRVAEIHRPDGGRGKLALGEERSPCPRYPLPTPDSTWMVSLCDYVGTNTVLPVPLSDTHTLVYLSSLQTDSCLYVATVSHHGPPTHDDPKPLTTTLYAVYPPGQRSNAEAALRRNCP